MDERLLHGGDLESAQERYDGELLDFSVNVNPLGMPPTVIEAAQRAIAASGRYPDPQCRRLKRALARRNGISASQIVCGNGAAELIFRLARNLLPRTALFPAPTFGEYGRALREVGCTLRHHLLRSENQFDVDETLADALSEDTELLVLCNPNNPTGRRVDPALLKELVRRCERQRIWLLVDESFLELAEGVPNGGLIPSLEHCRRLILLRSLTKSYAMPGLRLGYLLTADAQLARALENTGQPWPISLPAQWAGEAACEQEDWPERGKRLVAREKPRLQAALAAKGCTVWESAANYLLFRAPGDYELQEKLLKQGILIRSCGNFRGLGADYYRIAVRTGPENDRFLAAWNAL